MTINKANALTQYETTATAVSATRPTTANDGASLATWIADRIKCVNASWFITGDGADCTIDSPTGGSSGVEVWIYKANKAGTSKWRLIGYLMGGDVIPVVDASGGAAGPLLMIADATRIAICGTPSGGRTPTFIIEPVEVTS